MAANLEDIDMCSVDPTEGNDTGWRKAIKEMNKIVPAATDAPGEDGLYGRLMGDARIADQVGDLRAAHRAGALDKEAFAAQALERLRTSCIAPRPNLLEVDASDPIAVVGRARPVDARTLAALSLIVSGPGSSADQRTRWPVALPSDPVVAATASADRLILRFRSEADVKVWCWKMANEVFGNEGAGLLYTQNVEWEYPCAPTNLSRFLRYVSEGVVVADASSNLALAATARDVALRTGDAEYGFEGEPLSRWVARTVDRLTGLQSYATRDPPGFTSSDDEPE